MFEKKMMANFRDAKIVGQEIFFFLQMHEIKVRKSFIE